MHESVVMLDLFTIWIWKVYSFDDSNIFSLGGDAQFQMDKAGNRIHTRSILVIM